MISPDSKAPDAILVVDDNPVNLKLTRMLLVEQGYDVRTAEDAEQALMVLQLFQPTMLLVDVQLPGMDGLELTRQLRAKPEFNALRIVALTANAGSEDERSAVEAGCDGYIPKPIDPANFPGLVKGYLNLPALPRKAPKPAAPPPAKPAPAPEPAVPAKAEPATAQGSLESLREDFLKAGTEEARRMLARWPVRFGIRSVVPAGDNAEARGLFHRWAGVGSTLGFPQITTKAREAEALLQRPESESGPRIRELLEELLQLFTAAPAREARQIEIPPEIANGLAGRRVGFIGFESTEVARVAEPLDRCEAFFRQIPLRNAAPQSTLKVYDLLIARLPAGSDSVIALAQKLLDSGKPVLFVGARERLAALDRDQNRRYDVLAEPWEAEQLLMRTWLVLERARQKEADPAAQARRYNVVVGDDDPTALALIRSALEGADIDCRVADNGRAALAMARNNPPDLIILDVNMPYMDGFEVLAQLRNLGTTRKTRVMLLTGRDQEVDIVRGLSLGANDYVVKPFSPMELLARVKKLLEQPV